MACAAVEWRDRGNSVVRKHASGGCAIHVGRLLGRPHAFASACCNATQADHMLIQGNIIYDNCWWTVSATSGVVFAEKNK